MSTRKNYTCLLMALLFMIQVWAIKENDILITEIMYNPPESGTDQLEFIRITNVSAETIDLNGCYLSGVTLDIDTSIELAPKEHFIFCENKVLFDSLLDMNSIQWKTGSLSNSGETIMLYNSEDQLIDSVAYKKNGDWPKEANGNGYSIYFCPSNGMSNDDPENWFLGEHTFNGVDTTEVYLSLESECMDQLVNVSLINREEVEVKQYVSYLQVIKEGLFEITAYDVLGKVLFYSIATDEKIIDKNWLESKYIILKIESREERVVKKMVL